eukprot:gb/GECH01012733.1/.p1 GENE.gb/GECH01012733.1/~~gb/GECH01012733.1/.p1  ORF type:complete len:186 (+),score=35.87 gb/GECH01012733.1/:1-558(+)
MARKKVTNHARKNPLRINHNPANLSKTGLRNVKRHTPAIKFPKQQVTFILQSALRSTKEVHFRVPLEMTKPELKEYLRTFYDLDVTNVNTAVYHGKTRRNKTNFKEEKTEDFKKAIVTLASPVKLEGEFIQQMMQELARSSGVNTGDAGPGSDAMSQLNAMRDQLTPEQLEELDRMQSSEAGAGK